MLLSMNALFHYDSDDIGENAWDDNVKPSFPKFDTLET